MAGPYKRIIPCLDVKQGRVVKGVQFSALRDAGDPVELAQYYQDSGADELCLLDIVATEQERLAQLNTIGAVRQKIGIPLLVGGGVRAVEDFRRLLNAGADKVSVNSAAVERPALIAEAARAFGRQCVVLAIDARQNKQSWEVLIFSGNKITGIDALAWGREASSLGAGEILLTSWDRDGTGLGYDILLLQAMRRAVDVPIIASGGASSSVDLAQALANGADAVLAASMFHFGHTTIAQCKNDLSQSGQAVRL